MEKVLEIPSWESMKGIFATEAREATAPWLSRPCMGLAPGAKGGPAIGRVLAEIADFWEAEGFRSDRATLLERANSHLLRILPKP